MAERCTIVVERSMGVACESVGTADNLTRRVARLQAGGPGRVVISRQNFEQALLGPTVPRRLAE